MLFTTPTFLFFFLPLVLAAYALVRGTGAKNALLLAASLLFYAWGEPWFVLVLLGAIGFNYAAALIVDRRDGRARAVALAAAVAGNLAVLAVFKYADFAVRSLNAVAGTSLAEPGLPLPLGVSFFTFHCLSYVIDVFRRRVPADRRLTEVALYVALFPQLVAGPIVRYRSIAPRLGRRTHSLGRAGAGIRLFVIGLAQKLLLADPLSPLAEAVFDQTAAPGLLDAWAGAGAYALQIFFDFAGYSNMAIGLGLVFGFRLPRNFAQPYRSGSITEFWRRWHVSLSAWVRDYLYIPLGGNRHGRWRTYRNLVLVFLLVGLWHGASWTFVLWGAWHGAFLVIERAGLSRALKALPAPVAWAYAMLAVLGGWVLFRAPSLGQALEVWRGMLGLNGGAATPGAALAAAWDPPLALIALAAVAIALWPRRGFRRRARPEAFDAGLAELESLEGPRGGGVSVGRIGEAGAVLLLLLLSLLAVGAGVYSPFLYARF